MNWLRILPLACAMALAIGSAAAAPTDVLKVGLPGDHTDALPALHGSRLVTFRYSPDVSFAIRAMQDTFVNIELPEGETVQGFYLSDAVQWSYHVTGDNKRVLVKPLAPGLVNTGTLITDKRSYELTMLSVAPGEMWFQRVRWQIPGADGATDGLLWRGQATTPGSAPNADPATLDPAHLHFDYKISGHGPFTPVAVFDDGVRTWIKFSGVQDWPAVFAQAGHDMEVVDYSVHGDYIVIPLVSHALILRLRGDEIRLDRRG